VRWDELFADLETDAIGLHQREQDLEIADRTRIELSRIPLSARLVAGVGATVELRVDAVGPLRGRIERVTSRWLLLSAESVQWVVSVHALLGVRGLPVRARTEGPVGAVELRLGWGSAWRVLAQDRWQLHVVRRDGSSLDAVADRVGEDFVELAVTSSDRRLRELVPFSAVVAVRCPIA
jgi:hypothetical protein